MVSNSYRTYITGPKWRKKRQTALNFYGHKCMICGSRKRLEVHHVSYARLFKEHMADLRILCHKHHQEVTKLHWKMGKRTPGIVVWRKFVATKSIRKA